MSALVSPRGDLEDWLAWRRQGIGGSDAAAICGLDPWRGPYSVWLDKVEGTGQEESEAMRWGLLLEDVVAGEFERRCGHLVVDRQQRRIHPQREWMRATIDGLVADGEGSILGLYEGKCSAQISDWQHGVPERYQLQVQHNLEVCGLDRAWVAVLLRGNELRWFEVARDDEVIAALLQIEEVFWRRVEARTPPPVDGSEATATALRSAFRTSEPAAVELPPAVAELVAERQAAAELKRAAEERMRAAENALMAALGDAEVGTHEGRVIVTWRSVERSTLDTKALAAAHPEIAAAFTRPSRYRRLGFPGRGKEEE